MLDNQTGKCVGDIVSKIDRRLLENNINRKFLIGLSNSD